MSPTPEQIEAAAAAIWNYGDPFLSWGEVCGESFADETREKARAALEAAASVPPPAESSALIEAAEWVVCDLGYPFDFGNDIPPPAAFADAIVNVVLEDRDTVLHGQTLDRAGVLDWILDECPSFAPSSKEPTE